jgi:hypothetical protein
MAKWKHQKQFGIVNIINETVLQLEKVLTQELETLKKKTDMLERIQKMQRNENGSMGK